ncbi:uncharacterized protein LOC143223498 [Tachypleus tridentatus]|uniref:uncharacterized protein LOC143223498 n=1 Tax=Tachypleus tridentatus TaxID=6853 RepID=UPI003FD6BE6D
MSTLFTETNKNETIPMSSGAKTQLYDIAVGYREKTLKTTPNLNISHLPNNGSSIQFVDDLGVAKKETSYNIFSDKDSETRERNSFYVSDKSNSNEVEKQINKHSIEGSKEFRVKRNTRKISSEGSSGKIPLEPPQKDFSIENLEIIPFVAEDAVFKPLYFNKQEDNKETVIRKAEEREEVSKTREEIPDLSAHSSTLFETTLRPIMSAERTPQDCFIDGQLYINGETFKKSDPCLMCQCFYGEELCQQQHCPSPPSSECIMERLDGFCCPRYTCETTQEVSQGLHSENKRFQAYDVRPWVAATGVPIPSSEGKNTHSTTKYSNESEKLKDVEDIITGTFLSISDAPAPPVLMFGSSGTSSQTKRHGTHITQISAQRRKSNEGTSSMKNLASVLLVVDGDSTILDSTVKSNSKPFSVDSLINKPNQENKTVITIGNPSSHSVIRNGMPDNVPSRFAELVTEETLDIKHNQSKSKTHIVSLEESSQLKPNGSNWEQNTNTSENSFLKSFQSERSDTISISNQPERLEHSSLSVNKQETDKKHSFDSISLESLKPLSPNREEFGSLESNIGLLGVSSHEYEGSTIEPPKREKPGSFPSQTNHPETIFKPIRHFSESHIFPQGTTEEANLGKIQQESPMKEWDGEVDTQSSMQTVMSNIPIRTNWGSLKVSGCNIFGMFYGVEQVIPELSEPCKNCVCRASGVECAVTC